MAAPLDEVVTPFLSLKVREHISVAYILLENICYQFWYCLELFLTLLSIDRSIEPASMLVPFSPSRLFLRNNRVFLKILTHLHISPISLVFIEAHTSPQATTNQSSLEIHIHPE